MPYPSLHVPLLNLFAEPFLCLFSLASSVKLKASLNKLLSPTEKLSMKIRLPLFLVPHSMPLAIHIFLGVAPALLLLCASKSCLATQYSDCLSDTVTCGDVEFSYPFGSNGRGCGDPEFQLHSCDELGHPLITIGGDQYHILESSSILFWNGTVDSILTIVNDNMWGEHCNVSGDYSQLWLPTSHFQILDTYTNLTLWELHCDDPGPHNFHGSQFHKNLIRLCGDYWHYSFNPHGDMERRHCNEFQIPFNYKYYSPPHVIYNQTVEQGFEVSWHVDPERFQRCRACLNSNGYCGYDISNPATFLCYCADGTSNPDQCPDTVTQEAGTGNTSAILLGCYVVGVVLTAIALVLVVLLIYDASKQRNPSPVLPRMGSVQLSEGDGNDVANPPLPFDSFSANDISFVSTEKSSSIAIRL
eukprot:PITA_22343